jgi:hypothetical protein
MMGIPEQPGMIPRAMDQVFAAAVELAPQGWRYEMKASMLEIYNEELKDLLGKGPPAGKKHAVRGVLEWSALVGGSMAVEGVGERVGVVMVGIAGPGQ